MVEPLHASVTGKAMVAIFSYIYTASLTIFYLLIWFGVWSVFEARIRRVTEDQNDVVIDDDYDGNSVDRVQYEQCDAGELDDMRNHIEHKCLDTQD